MFERPQNVSIGYAKVHGNLPPKSEDLLCPFQTLIWGLVVVVDWSMFIVLGLQLINHQKEPNPMIPPD